MRYEEHPPPPAVAPYVACLWTLTGEGSGPSFELILPDGRPELVVHRGDPFRQKLASGAIRRQPRRLVVGQMLGAVALSPGARIESLGIRFTPAGLAPLCPFPQARLADRIVPVDAIDAPGLQRLADAAIDAPTLAGALRAVRRALPREFGAAPAPDARLLAAVARITASGGATPVEAITRAVGATPRWLERQFQASVGVTPKRLARLVRFRRALAALDEAGGREGAALALDHGYYDQAHFIADFRAFAGDAPRRFVRARLAELTRYFVDSERAS
jgi:methylphosphotriester-DNA--protein-cysteine methyltransferase